MACASQSALDYVQSARDHLVRTLEGFTEIVENLKQKGFFSEEEVSKIKTEGDDFKKTGIIVDSVIKKGEEACYEFLRIIDRTRKKSGERPPSFLENAELPSSPCNTFDLNYWISCFSFKEDVNMDVTYSQDPEPCHRYQLKLKSKAQKISERSWTQSKAVLFNKQSSLSYTSLVLDTQGQASPSKIKKSKIKKSSNLHPKKLKTYIPENKPGTSPDELLKSYEKNILLVGKPGVGKTAVVHQMLKLWSEKDNKDLDYMFYFDMRETPTITEVHKLEDLLFGVFSEPDEGKDEVLEDIKKNADSVTLIFDGVTDVPSTSVVLELIQKTLLPEAKIIITCRPEVESADFLLDWDCLRVEVKGFSEQGIREYLSKNLSEEHLNQVLCNLELFTLCHVPMYALMVAACFEGSDFSPHPCTVTEIYLNILHICIQRNVCRRSENERIQCSAILSLAEAAFCATEEKNENIKSLPQLDSCVHLSFLNTLLIQVGPTVKKPLCAFLHYTVQEFFAALWVLKDPERTRGFLQQCLTEDTKHMRHLVPFLCGLLNEKSKDLLESLIPSQQLRDTSDWFFKDLVNTFVDRSEDREIDLVFLCQCLYESQSVEACLCLLDKLDYCLDLSGETLDPQCCCAVSYVISQSEEKKRRGETVISECCCYVSYVISYSKEWKIQLNLEDATVSNQGLRSLLGCLNRLQRSYSLSQQLWTLCLLSEGEVDYRSLLCFAENQLHLPVSSERQLYERAVDVLQKSAEKVNVCLHGDWRVCQHVSEVLLQCLPNIHSLSFCRSSGNLSDQTEFLMNLIIGAAEREQQTGEKILNMLSSVCSHPTFPLHDDDDNNDGINISPNKYRLDFLLDLCSRVKDYETQTGRSVLPSLQSVFQSAPAVWSIKLSETKTSILLEVLKPQSEKKQVELIGCSDEESEVRSFLQCVPYISQLSFCQSSGNLSDQTEFLMNLIIGAAETEQQTGEKILNMLSSVCSHPTFPLHEDNDNDDDINSSPNKYRLDFLLDLYSHLKDYETQTGRSVLPSLQSVFQSAPEDWSIKLSETKTSILLEVLKLQSEKKAVKLIGCSDEESEVRSFLQCVPYISQLSFCRWPSGNLSNQTEFFINLFIEAAETEQQTGEKILKKLSSVCREESFSLFNPAGRFYNNADFPCEFLFNLYSHVKDYETQTGRSVLPSLQSVFQSAPAVWPIKLSETKTSILLEVLKLQSEKKPVELYGCSDEESEVRSFLQCVPYISQLRFSHSSGNLSDQIKLFTNLIIQAAEREQQTGEKIFKMLSSVCSYQGFPLHDCYDVKYRLDFLLDLCSCLKDYETQTGRSVLPSLQSVFQSAPAVWSIKLSERKTSILLEVLKLQSEKKPVQLIGRSDEESEVRSFLQCVPYISQLSFCRSSGNLSDQTEFLMNLFIGAAETEQQTGEKILNMLSSVCSHQTFPLQRDCDHRYRSDFLLDLCSRVKDYETQTGRSVLPSLQSVFQSAPAVWSIKLSETKTSILLEVLKLQSEKKPVELVECSDEESEVRSFLQCVPYISQLSFCRSSGNLSDQTEFLMNLFIGAAETEQQTGEKILNMLSSVCSHQTFPLQRDCDHRYRSDFLLDLCSRVKDYETQTGRSVLPSLQSVFQSAPAVWSIKLSDRKTSILLEVLKLQSEKKPVELDECSDEESEVRSFLQCVPYISQLSFCRSSVNRSGQTEFLMNLIIGAAEREQQTGEKILNMLSSVCSHQTFPLYCTYDEKYCLDFLLDLYSHLKDYETQTGRSVLPSLQSVFQSAPAFWFIDLFYRKTSILPEVLKLQSEKKAVKLYGCSYEESEVRSFLQCVPYISQLSFSCWSSDVLDQIKFLMNLIIGAAEREQQTGEKILNMLSSVCSYKKFPFREDYVTEATIQRQSDFLLDLYSHVKDYETQTGRSVLPSLQSVFQSAPFVWFIKLSDRKASILLEVLKLQSEKKQVELGGCSYEESEVRSFLQCVPYISQLSFYCYPEYISNQTKFLMNLFIGAAEREQQTGEKILKMLSSVCSHQTFPLQRDCDHRYRSDFLLDLCSRVKDYETQTGRSVLPSLQSVLSVPALWFIDLSETKTSILLEVLKLQSEKKAVELDGCSDEESEERSFLQCVPYISQLSFCWSSEDLSDQTEFLMNLIIGAAEREQQTGEKILNMLSSVCSHPTFPLHFDIDDDDVDDDVHEYRLYFLCDLYSRVKDYETQTGRSVLPSLQSVFQSAPAVWSIKLSETKTSILLEVLKLQSEKKAVQLDGCSDEESEVRSFLQCVPYISQLSCDPGFFQSVCTSFAVTSEQEVQQMSSLLQLLDFNLLLTGWLSSETCSSVGRVLGLCGSKVNLSLTCRKISVRGASLLFKHTSHIRSLQLSSDLVLLLLQWVRTSEVSPSLIIEELSVIESMTYQSEKVLLSIVSSVASLLSSWTVRQLDLSELCIPTQHLTALLRHHGSLTIRVNKENLQQLPVLLHEIQDQELTQCFFGKVGGDLTSCFLDWEVLYFLLQHSSGQTITVNLMKISSVEENFSHLLPFLDRVVFKRPSPSFVLSAIRHIHEAHSSHSVPSLLRSLDHVISLTCTELDSVDFSALLFILHHSDGVKLNLLWTSIPAENMESLLFTLDKVSQLSVDRTLLLRLVHCCAAAQQRASSVLLGALQHRLDLSCSSFMDLAEEEQREALRLTAADCWAISTILGYSSQETQLDLRDCEVGENGLDALLPVLDRVRLRASKALLLQLVSLITQQSQRVRWAETLWRALDGELDLSHTTLDQGTCSSLAQVLDSSEGLTELDLSHCQLTDQLLSMLIPQLHKVKVLDLSHNNLTDVSTNMLLSLTSISPFIHTVRVFGNSIEDKWPFTDKRFEI